ncbi:MAG: peptidoglycan-binding domain-containing protein [Candidatus Omnitrophica bacterium]|nr:peptidoglycan-binding domain-containing protein [Candidatus Omnitrophota bacterium]
MTRFIALFLFLAVALTGCGTVSNRALNDRITSIDQRVSDLEKKQATEAVMGNQGAVTYVTPAADVAQNQRSTESTSTYSDKVKMTAEDIQIALKNAGYYNGAIDGKLGNRSRQAIKKFQADNNITADGIAGAQTKKLLKAYLTK